MKKIKVYTWENGAFEADDEKGEEMEVLEAISRKEFIEKFPESNAYMCDTSDFIFLENGAILWDEHWNGYEYTSKDNIVSDANGIYQEVTTQDGEVVVGYIQTWEYD